MRGRRLPTWAAVVSVVVVALLAGGVSRREVAKGIAADVKGALTALLVRSTVVGLAAAALVTAVAFRRRRAVVVGTAASALALLTWAALAALTVNTRALQEPSYTGLLTPAPDLTGGLADVEGRFSAYRERIATLTGSVSRLYAILSDLPSSPAPVDDTRILWISDIHDEAFTLMSTLIKEFGCLGVVDTGDDTDLGSEAENGLLAPIAGLGVPYVVVRGNHESRGVTQPHLASATDDSPEPMDVALVHEPGMGHVPPVLDGHTHRRAHRRAHRVADGTLELTQGFSGGAGLRTLETTSPLPLAMSVLHFDPLTHALLTVDDVSVAGVGESSATVDRHAAVSYGLSPPA